MFGIFRSQKSIVSIDVSADTFDELALALQMAGRLESHADETMVVNGVTLKRQAPPAPALQSSGYPPGYRPITPKRT